MDSDFRACHTFGDLNPSTVELQSPVFGKRRRGSETARLGHRAALKQSPTSGQKVIIVTQEHSHLSGFLQAVSDIESLHTRSLLGSRWCNPQKWTARISAAPVRAHKKGTEAQKCNYLRDSECLTSTGHVHLAHLAMLLLNYEQMKYVFSQLTVHLSNTADHCHCHQITENDRSLSSLSSSLE